MSFLDVHRLDHGLVIDCQSDLLSHLATRFVIPLRDAKRFGGVKTRLNPVVRINDHDWVVMAELAATLRRSDLGKNIGSVADYRDQIIGAIDMLISGI